MADTTGFLDRLPKCELHLHIEGTLEPDLRFRLGRRNGIPLEYASPEEVPAAYESFNDLPSFLASYYAGMSVLQTEPDFYDLAWAYLERAAAQNVAWTEIFFDPQAHTSRGVPFDLVIRGIRRAQADAETRLGVGSALIMCFLRDFQAEYAMATLLESLPYRQWIAGVGLDSDEHGNPPNKFAAVFERARREGYRLTVHCDIDQEGTLEHIRQCVHDIGVDRIDHGTNVLADDRLTQDLVDRGIGLTSCPLSNRCVSDGTKSGDIDALLRRGVKIMISSDDPAYYGGYVQENLQALVEEIGLGEADLVRLQHNAIDISWAPPAVKRDFRERLAALG